mmetsp:Transcript_16905/g.45815  ORF Transcript_16905/g.45815 Transcript_16905/m.45815 type:complete len:207 (-) Transcript_16905:480-1100(-)
MIAARATRPHAQMRVSQKGSGGNPRQDRANLDSAADEPILPSPWRTWSTGTIGSTEFMTVLYARCIARHQVHVSRFGLYVSKIGRRCKSTWQRGGLRPPTGKIVTMRLASGSSRYTPTSIDRRRCHTVGVSNLVAARRRHAVHVLGNLIIATEAGRGQSPRSVSWPLATGGSHRFVFNALLRRCAFMAYTIVIFAANVDQAIVTEV